MSEGLGGKGQKKRENERVCPVSVKSERKIEEGEKQNRKHRTGESSSGKGE